MTGLSQFQKQVLLGCRITAEAMPTAEFTVGDVAKIVRRRRGLPVLVDATEQTITPAVRELWRRGCLTRQPGSDTYRITEHGYKKLAAVLDKEYR